MSIKSHIELLTSNDANMAYQAMKDLLALSLKSNEVYPYFDLFVQMMKDTSTNSYIRTRGIHLIAYNAQWDTEDKVNSIVHDYLRHIEDEKPTVSRQCIQNTVLIAKAKPELIDTILEALKSYHFYYQESMQNLIYKDREKAIKQIQSLTW